MALKRWPIIHKVVASLRRGINYVPAVEGAPLSTNTMMSWRRKNPRLDRLILAAMGKSNEKRTDGVEDAMFKRLIEGRATPAEYIFYLSNRRPEKWKNYMRENTSFNLSVDQRKVYLWRYAENTDTLPAANVSTGNSRLESAVSGGEDRAAGRENGNAVERADSPGN